MRPSNKAYCSFFPLFFVINSHSSLLLFNSIHWFSHHIYRFPLVCERDHTDLVLSSSLCHLCIIIWPSGNMQRLNMSHDQLCNYRLTQSSPRPSVGVWTSLLNDCFFSFHGQCANLHISQRMGASPATPRRVEDSLMAQWLSIFAMKAIFWKEIINTSPVSMGSGTAKWSSAACWSKVTKISRHILNHK